MTAPVVDELTALRSRLATTTLARDTFAAQLAAAQRELAAVRRELDRVAGQLAGVRTTLTNVDTAHRTLRAGLRGLLQQVGEHQGKVVAVASLRALLARTPPAGER